MLEQVKGTPGFVTGFRLSAEDLTRVKKAIKRHLAQQLTSVAPHQVDLFESTPLEQYHTISDSLPHAQLLTRTARILPLDAVEELRSTSLFKQLEGVLGHFEISDEEKIGRESISIRLVRPGMDTDVGSLHADDWFWKLYDFSLPKDKARIKLWAAICCEPGKSGLLLSPGSHQRDWKYSTFDRSGMAKPLLDPEEKPELQMFESEPGDAVVFNYRLLHGGAVTRGSITRVSLEFTMLVPSNVYSDTATH